MQSSRPGAAPIAAALFSSLLLSCRGAPSDAAPVSKELAGEQPDGFDVQRYDLTGEYDWARGRLIAAVDVTLTATVPELTSVVLDSAVAEVTAVHSNGVALPFTVDEEGRTLAIDVQRLAVSPGSGPVVIHIDYEAASGDALVAIPVRAGDPAAARAVYTSSEPTGARRWMPCHDRTDDRAVFSADLRMAGDEALIANGDLELDQKDEGGRRMRYATRYPLPTYLMAFAVSTFEVERGQAGDLPIAVWHRRGVPGDYGKLLGEIGRELDVFTGKLGPYPFEKYAIVMLPEFPGGMENAGITFQAESRTAEPSLSEDVGLSAHELGHQWFGDLVTVATWDDLWIKEGMATLLSAEAERMYEDIGGSQTLLGDSFDPSPGRAVRDRSLSPGQKYTSGPYDRAAWVLTQIRAVVGEDAFWGALRGVLDAHRFGTVGTDEFLAAFEPALGSEAAARARRAVDAKALPKVTIAAADGGGAEITLHDPEGILVAPFSIAWYREDGAIEEETIVPEQPLLLQRKAAGDFLVLDPRDVHPSLADFCANDTEWRRFDTLVAPLRMPAEAAETSRFARLPGVHARAALSLRELPPVAPEALSDFIASLGSEAAKALSIEAACDAAGAEEDPAARFSWTAAITDALRAAPHYAGLGYVDSYDACADLVAPAQMFSSDWATLAKGEAGVSEPRLDFLSKFTLPPADALAAWGEVVETSPSLRARSLAAYRIERQATRLSPHAQDERSRWRTRVAGLISGSEVPDVLYPLIEAAVSVAAHAGNEDAAILTALGAVLRSPATLDVQAQAVCAAHAIVGGDVDAFHAFAASLEGAPRSEIAAALLADPSDCGR